jgi:hypothetical protein
VTNVCQNINIVVNHVGTETGKNKPNNAKPKNLAKLTPTENIPAVPVSDSVNPETLKLPFTPRPETDPSPAVDKNKNNIPIAE